MCARVKYYGYHVILRPRTTRFFSYYFIFHDFAKRPVIIVEVRSNLAGKLIYTNVRAKSMLNYEVIFTSRSDEGKSLN